MKPHMPKGMASRPSEPSSKQQSIIPLTSAMCLSADFALLVLPSSDLQPLGDRSLKVGLYCLALPPAMYLEYLSWHRSFPSSNHTTSTETMHGIHSCVCSQLRYSSGSAAPNEASISLSAKALPFFKGSADMTLSSYKQAGTRGLFET